MNTYTYTFFAECPANSEQIIYQLTIESRTQILVEHIKTACALHRKGYHEAIADDLALRFGGRQQLVANHHGVTIKTERAPRPDAPTSQINPVSDSREDGNE